MRKTDWADIKSIYKLLFKESWSEAWQEFLPSGKRLRNTIFSAVVGSVIFFSIYSWEKLMEQILTYAAFALAPISVLILWTFICNFIRKPVDHYRALYTTKLLEEIMLKLKEFRRSANDLSEKYAIDSTKTDQDYTSWKKEVEDFLKDKLNDSWVDKFNGIDCSITDTLMNLDLADNTRDSLFGGTPKNPNLAPNNIAFHLKKRIHSLSEIIDDLLPRTIPLKADK